MNPQSFKIIPEEGELDQVAREFNFCPSQVVNPRLLSRDQVTHFNRWGYLAGLSIFGPEEVRELRAYFDKLLAETLAAGGDSYSISTAHLLHGRIYDLLGDPQITHIVRDLLGDHVIGWGSHFFCKMPGDGKAVSWHQDASYWPLDRAKTVTVWLAIDDADRENACMQFIAGSHLHGHLPFRESDHQEGNVLNQTVEDPLAYGTVIDVPLKAGQISVHSDLLLHGSGANDSQRRRCGLTLRYCTPDVKAACGWHEKGVVVCGEDNFGNWANPPRPQS